MRFDNLPKLNEEKLMRLSKHCMESRKALLRDILIGGIIIIAGIGVIMALS